jgi:phosphoribosylaminoimidazole-succinocarboxamide synthase
MSLKDTHLKFEGKVRKYSGKVRDTYILNEQLIVIVSTDRISAFDVILPNPIPYKGQVLNQTAAYFHQNTEGICPSYLLSVPDPNISIGLFCDPIPIEMVVRGYLCGHAWRVYKSGKRALCGVKLPEGMKENDPFPEPILTPATKSTIGHDEDISEMEIIKMGILSSSELEQMKNFAFNLYKKGQEMARSKGLILADTKYEFGYYENKIYLIDEIHTPDSSRYFYSEGFEERQKNNEPQKQLSKEFVREWLMSNGFHGQEGTEPPSMAPDFVEEVSERYIHLYETVTGNPFQKQNYHLIHERLQNNALKGLKEIGFY